MQLFVIHFANYLIPPTGYLFIILLTEQIGMRACIEHHKDEFAVVLFPDEQPIGLYVALPLALSIAMQLVG